MASRRIVMQSTSMRASDRRPRSARATRERPLLEQLAPHDPALDHDLRGGRHQQVRRLGPHDLDRLAQERPGRLVLATDPLHARHGAHEEAGVVADGERDRRVLAERLVAPVDRPPVVGAEEPHAHAPGVVDVVAVDAGVDGLRLGVAHDAHAGGDVRAAVELVVHRDRQAAEVDSSPVHTTALTGASDRSTSTAGGPRHLRRGRCGR
jgi:hypothetical protein